ncbi:hypothetical protein BDF19DRAFT_433851 [Syncephalis fuscata]|nr:hypothetical protein BDF19DRAFT_433851 [Syncephalis fuscata]
MHTAAMNRCHSDEFDDNDEFDNVLADDLLMDVMDAFERDHFTFGSAEADAAAVAELDAIERTLVGHKENVSNNSATATSLAANTNSLAYSTQATDTISSQQYFKPTTTATTTHLSNPTTLVEGAVRATGAITDYFSRHALTQATTTTSTLTSPPSTADATSRSLFPPKFDITDWDCTPCAHSIDEEAIATWIYPTNRPIRDYQYDIIRTALFVNTLACIPTGLGKTFIATVVMYNYYRWFPNTKIIFACPTKPLVSQQLRAYREMVDTPINDTVELTGELRPEIRSRLWREKRVFFLTPQTMHRDLLSGICPREQVSCLVIDEAHKATGNFAYCEIARELRPFQVRLLALTATPGGDPDIVQAIVDNLRIGRIEIRTEDTDQVRPIATIRNLLGKCIQPIIDRVRGGPGIEFYNKDPTSLAPFQVIKAMQNYRGAMARNASPKVMGDLMTLHRLAYSMDLMLQHGIRSFLVTIAPLKGAVTKEAAFTELMRIAKAAVQSPTAPSHPKVTRLISLVRNHFEQHEQELKESGAIGSERRDTRIMIFSEYRDSVSELVDVLNAHRPLIRASQFIGRGTRTVGKKTKKSKQSNKKKSSKKRPRLMDSEEEREELENEDDIAVKQQVQKGFGQKEQQKVLELFKSGHYNTLVATSIGEEGLDIGDVDLIICFDAQSSPTRMLQRMGRTGRHRQGRIVMLLTEGKEASRYSKSQAMYKNVQRAIMDPDRIRMCPGNPRILPGTVKPRCDLKIIYSAESNINENTTSSNSNMNSSSSTSSMLDRVERYTRGTTNKKGDKDPYLSEIEEEEWRRRYYIDSIPSINLSKFTVRQTRITPIHRIQHTNQTLGFVRLMYMMDELVLDNGDDTVKEYEEMMCRHLRQSDIWQPSIDGVNSRPLPSRLVSFCCKNSQVVAEDITDKDIDQRLDLHFPTDPINLEEEEEESNNNNNETMAMLLKDTMDSSIISSINLSTPNTDQHSNNNINNDNTNIIHDDDDDDDGFPITDSLLWNDLLNESDLIVTTTRLNTTPGSVFNDNNTLEQDEDTNTKTTLPSNLYLTTLPDLSTILNDTDDLLNIPITNHSLNTSTTSNTTPSNVHHQPLISDPINDHDLLDNDLLLALDQASLDSLDNDLLSTPIQDNVQVVANIQSTSPPSSLPVQRGRFGRADFRNKERARLLSSSPTTNSTNTDLPPTNEIRQTEHHEASVPPPTLLLSSSPPLIHHGQSAEVASNRHSKTKRRKACMGQWFEMEAELSGTEASADEIEEDEGDDIPNSFINDDDISVLLNDSANQETDTSMTNFYRESLLSQADEHFGGRRALFGGSRYTMRYNGQPARYTATRPVSETDEEDLGSLADFIIDSNEEAEEMLISENDEVSLLP